MDKARSFYIEILRIIAASYVFIYHFGSETSGYTLSFSTTVFNETLGLHYNSAHYFVIVFFVLSGFLITMSASRKNLTMKDFLIIRLGRLYSVLIPSLIFSYLVMFILLNYCHVPPQNIANTTNLPARFILNILFLAQSWTLSSTPPLNAPFWSIDYEFIYYLLLGGALLLKAKQRIIVLLIVLLVAGPKVLLLFPAWLIGSLLYYISAKYLLPYRISLTIFLVTLVIICLAIVDPFIIPFTKLSSEKYAFGYNLFYSWNYFADYCFALIIGLNLYSAFGISGRISAVFEWRLAKKAYTFTRKLGNCTFTLYLFHLPLLFLYSSIFPYDKASVNNQLFLIAGVALSVFMIARYTEWKVEFWRSLVSHQFDSGSALKNFLINKLK
ncbi:MAG: acyltransferase family protein [Pedobacter sp.]